MQPETRTSNALPEITSLGGLLVTYGKPAEAMKFDKTPYSEIFMHRVFARCLEPDGRDFLCKVFVPGREGGDPIVLARSSGKIQLREEENGVSYRLAIGDDPEGQLLLRLSNCMAAISFTFVVEEKGDNWKDNVREIRQATIVGMVIRAQT